MGGVGVTGGLVVGKEWNGSREMRDREKQCCRSATFLSVCDFSNIPFILYYISIYTDLLAIFLAQDTFSEILYVLKI
jgi:hypothetical protein